MRHPHRGLNWCAPLLGLLGAIFIFGLIFLPRACHAQTNTQLNLSAAQLHSLGLLAVEDVQRTYWPTSIDTLWIGHQKHTHIAVTGRVAYTRTEEDGDLHIRLNSLADSTKFVIAECIPALPCLRPTKGRIITVRGVSRFDPEHGWRELHPVEFWEYTK